MSHFTVSPAKTESPSDTFWINLVCERTGLTKSTRIVTGRDFDDALDKSLESQPESGFIIGTVSRWDSNSRNWQHFRTPVFDLAR